jgi:hypothetical protein
MTDNQNKEFLHEVQIRLNSNIYFLEQFIRDNQDIVINKDQLEDGNPEYLSEIIEDLQDIANEVEKEEEEKEETKESDKVEVTFDEVEKWLGTSNPEEEAISVLVDIANGEYLPKIFKEEVISLNEEE